jgi:hypothetical protein
VANILCIIHQVNLKVNVGSLHVVFISLDRGRTEKHLVTFEEIINACYIPNPRAAEKIDPVFISMLTKSWLLLNPFRSTLSKSVRAACSLNDILEKIK